MVTFQYYFNILYHNFKQIDLIIEDKFVIVIAWAVVVISIIELVILIIIIMVIVVKVINVFLLHLFINNPMVLMS